MLSTVIANEISLMGTKIGEKELKGILFGNSECFDLKGFYQYLHDTENNKLYQVYFDTTDEDGDKIDDLGSVDYTHSFYYEEVENPDLVEEIINEYYKDEYEEAKR